jgi:hypothetical protein
MHDANHRRRPGIDLGAGGDAARTALPAIDRPAARRDARLQRDGESLSFEDVDAFIPGTLSRVVITGPCVLYRFCSASDARADQPDQESWWTRKETIDRFLALVAVVPDLAAREERFVRALRHALAVSVDWNRMTHYRTLAVPYGAAIDALSGLAQWQLEISLPSQKRGAGAVSGGMAVPAGSAAAARLLAAEARAEAAGTSGDEQAHAFAGGAVQYRLCLSTCSGPAASRPRAIALLFQ